MLLLTCFLFLGFPPDHLTDTIIFKGSACVIFSMHPFVSPSWDIPPVRPRASIFYTVTHQCQRCGGLCLACFGSLTSSCIIRNDRTVWSTGEMQGLTSHHRHRSREILLLPVLWWDGVLVCSGCQDMVPQTGGFKQQKSVFSQFGGQKSEVRLVGLVPSLRSIRERFILGLSLAYSCLLLVFFRCLPSTCLCPNSLSYKDTSHIGLGVTLMTSF